MDASHEAWLLLRALVALLAVLALAVAVLRFGLPWLVRQRAAGHPRQVEVEDVCLLDRGHRLYVVRFGDEQLLLASSRERVLMLSRRPAGPARSAVTTPADSTPARGAASRGPAPSPVEDHRP